MNQIDNCLFCKIVTGDIPSFKVYEDDKTYVFLDIRPVTKGHMLVIPKKHAQYIKDLSEDTAGHLMKIARKMNMLAREKLACDDVFMHLSDGKDAGQEIPHCHLHVIPRYKGDGFGFKFPEGYSDPTDMKKIKEAFDALKN